MNNVTSVDEYILNHEKWQEGLILLRELLLSTELTETIKWGGPVYTINGKNVVGMGGFKKHMAIWFFQGALLKDKRKLMVSAMEFEALAMRQMRFRAHLEIDLEIVHEYVVEAIKNQKAGKQVSLTQHKPFEIPTELKQAFRDDPQIKKAFEKFSMARKRQFALYVASAKREVTRYKRVDKVLSMIMNTTRFDN